MVEHRSLHGAAKPLEPPRFEQSPPLRITGLRGRVNEAAAAPALWARFAPHFGRVPGAADRVGYGLCLPAADGEAGCFDYVAGCAVNDFAGVPADWARVSIPAQRYAVFAHRQHVSKIRDTIDAIFSRWLPGSGCTVVPAGEDRVAFFERYGEGFDPHTGSGDIEVWVPVNS